MPSIQIDPGLSFIVRFVADFPLVWQVVRVRAGAEVVVAHGATTDAPPPPPDTAEVPAGRFEVGDTFQWSADVFAPPNAAANYTLRVTTTQAGLTINDSGAIQGTIAANGDKIEKRSLTCV